MDDVGKISTNIDDYTYAELLLLLNLNEEQAKDTDAIFNVTEKFILKYQKAEKQSLVNFFYDIREALTDYAIEINKGESKNIGPQAPLDEQWTQSANALKQDDPVQNEKITDRFQKIDVYGNENVPMERQQLGVNNTHNVPVVQDGKLNPTLENTVNRMVVIDSFYRQESASGNISTDFTLDLSDKLNNVLQMRLYSIQIPLTYYNIDDIYGNTCFWISDGTQDIPISISPGSYKAPQLVLAIDAAMINAGFTGTTTSYDPITFKITLNYNGGVFTPPAGSPYSAFVISAATKITFFNSDKALICQQTCIPQALHVNETLGYNMGFQTTEGFVTVNPSGNIADSVPELFGPRYFILVVDDFNQNHLNNGMVTITEPSKIVNLPSYFTTDHSYVCEDQSGNLVPQLIQSAPRTLTQNQIYTINQIIQNNKNNLDTRAKAPSTTNVLGILPIKPTSTGNVYTDFSGPIQENARIYFGPVDIERLRVRLLDDKGNTLNLNGANFSFTLVCELLYQY